MPAYELFALAKPHLERAQRIEVVRAAANAVFNGGGVLMDVKSYGNRETAYTLRRSGEAYDSAFMWQLAFHAAPQALSALEHGLKVDERVLRYILHKRRVFQAMPTTHKIAKETKCLISKQQTSDLEAARAAGAPKWWDPQLQKDGTLSDPATADTALDLVTDAEHRPKSPVYESTIEWYQTNIDRIMAQRKAEALQAPSATPDDPQQAEGDDQPHARWSLHITSSFSSNAGRGQVVHDPMYHELAWEAAQLKACGTDLVTRGQTYHNSVMILDRIVNYE
ncbi:hypothetical protein WJX73_000413 [Symbiochloris irregularis]|uniref:Ribosomal protein S6 n=1 Tax=Symbiochloris irregularis TaxID=706552 RepID=A0AAW1PJ48_9CHLO